MNNQQKKNESFQRSGTFDEEEDSDDENRVVETSPDGRFERYNICLGKGAYKEVFKAFDQENGFEVAWNHLRLDNFSKRDQTRILSEIRILESLRNDSIINLFSSWIAKGKDGKEKVIFITELMTSGTLKNYIKKTKGQIKPKILRSWSRQILNGLLYLHTRDPPIIHRDLKCENIFINGHNGQAKIGDMGLAAIKYRDHMSSVLGTPEFMAPELYEENYDEKVDVYAFGMVVLEMVTREYPYKECTNQAQIYKKVSSNIKPQALQKIADEKTRSFIELCILFDKNVRPSVEELLNHEFLADTGLCSLSGSTGSLTLISPIFSPKDTPKDTPVNSTSNLMENFSSFPFGDNNSSSISNISATNSPRFFSPILSSPMQNMEEILYTNTPAHITASFDVVDSDTHTFHITKHIDKENMENLLPDGMQDGILIEVIGEPSLNEVILQMVYCPKSSHSETIKFPFNLDEDTATDVISEMVQENLIHEQDEQLARRKLEAVIRKVLLGRRNNISNGPQYFQQDSNNFLVSDEKKTTDINLLPYNRHIFSNDFTHNKGLVNENIYQNASSPIRSPSTQVNNDVTDSRLLPPRLPVSQTSYSIPHKEKINSPPSINRNIFPTSPRRTATFNTLNSPINVGRNKRNFSDESSVSSTYSRPTTPNGGGYVINPLTGQLIFVQGEDPYLQPQIHQSNYPYNGLFTPYKLSDIKHHHPGGAGEQFPYLRGVSSSSNNSAKSSISSSESIIIPNGNGEFFEYVRSGRPVIPNPVVVTGEQFGGYSQHFNRQYIPLQQHIPQYPSEEAYFRQAQQPAYKPDEVNLEKFSKQQQFAENLSISTEEGCSVEKIKDIHNFINSERQSNKSSLTVDNLNVATNTTFSNIPIELENEFNSCLIKKDDFDESEKENFNLSALKKEMNEFIEVDNCEEILSGIVGMNCSTSGIEEVKGLGLL
ncbi:Serine/threonine-protein kinase wnk3 [Lobulomyces angularis]|nr:Serine/threonine-protein kinase wnk3 [Lobulomyces angularis]